MQYCLKCEIKKGFYEKCNLNTRTYYLFRPFLLKERLSFSSYHNHSFNFSLSKSTRTVNCLNSKTIRHSLDH